MSFMLTTAQIKARTKTQTRRLGWLKLKKGDTLRAVVKSMGLKKGEKVVALAFIRVIAVRRERLDAITQEDVAREGYPGKTPAEFIAMFCGHMKATPATIVTVIDFEYL